MAEPLSHVVPGQPVRADQYNALVDALLQLQQYALPPQVGWEGGGGPKIEAWLGTTNAAGQAAYTDERYWVKRSYCNESSGGSESSLQSDFTASTGSAATQTTVTNVCEYIDQTHNLPANLPVLCFTIRDIQAGNQAHHLMAVASGILPPGVKGDTLVHDGDEWNVLNKPGSDGTFLFQCVVAATVPTISWVEVAAFACP